MRRAVATVIVVGRTEGLWWEITTSMKVVEQARLLFFFPYASKTLRSGSRIADLFEFVGRWNLSRRRYNQMEAERRERYQIFRKHFATEFDYSLPTELGSALFLDFLLDGSARLLERKSTRWWKYAFPPITGANILVDLWPGRISRLHRFDLGLTMQPFLMKLKRLSR
jgi:hypothetical protein